MFPVQIATAHTPPTPFSNNAGYSPPNSTLREPVPRAIQPPLVAPTLSKQASLSSKPRTCTPLLAPDTPPQNEPLNLPWELIPGTCPVDPNILTVDQLSFGFFDPLSLSYDRGDLYVYDNEEGSEVAAIRLKKEPRYILNLDNGPIHYNPEDLKEPGNPYVKRIDYHYRQAMCGYRRIWDNTYRRDDAIIKNLINRK